MSIFFPDFMQANSGILPDSLPPIIPEIIPAYSTLILMYIRMQLPK